jgi:hypothetical protein
MKSTTYPYHVVLVPKTKHKKKKRNESGINYPGELKKRRILHGDTKSARNGSVIGSDVTYRFLEYWIALRKVCSFRKNQTKVTYPPSTTRARELQPPAIFPLAVPSLAASTFTFGALLWRYRKFKFKF